MRDIDLQFMNIAIAEARKGIAAGQSPFGAAIVKNGDLVLAAHNVVIATTDSTAHAEVNAIRLACKKLGTIDLSGCTIYSTTEPCPMCFSAIHWARFDRIVFGASIEDATKAGFNELSITNEQMAKYGGAKVQIERGIAREEAAKLFQEYKGTLY